MVRPRVLEQGAAWYLFKPFSKTALRKRTTTDCRYMVSRIKATVTNAIPANNKLWPWRATIPIMINPPTFAPHKTELIQ